MFIRTCHHYLSVRNFPTLIVLTLPWSHFLHSIEGMADRKKLVTLRITEEQKEAIQGFFTHFDWDLEIVCETFENANVTEELGDPQSKISESEGEKCGHEVSDDAADITTLPLPLTEGQCPECFCTPCITFKPQKWLGNGQTAGTGNNAIRRDRYRKFWKVLNDRGAWLFRNYTIKKSRQLKTDDSKGDIVWIERYCDREIMYGLKDTVIGR